MSDNEGEGATGGSNQKPAKPLHASGEKGAIGGVKTETTSPHEDTNPASLNDLVKAIPGILK